MGAHFCLYSARLFADYRSKKWTIPFFKTQSISILNFTAIGAIGLAAET